MNKLINPKQTIQFISNWLNDYAVNSKCNGFVVGVSGGIDSALTSFLCAETGLKTICLRMPIHQANIQNERAEEHINFLKSQYNNVQSFDFELSPVYDSFKRQIPQLDSINFDLALANTRARLRMTTLYFVAGVKNLLVAGTGNKVEDFGVGFYTKYGDGGVDLSPIADLTKTEVYTLAKEARIAKSILMAPPTDGLWGDNRTDEDQLGASYSELEWAMERDQSGSGLEGLDGRKLQVMKIYLNLNRANQHKMKPIPVCIIPENFRVESE